MAAVTIHQVDKIYGEGGRHPVTAVKKLNMQITDGEIIGLLGSSGCGKSSTLRMIAGLEEITDGTILLNGRVINDVAPKNRDIAMVFQNYALYPHLTVAENMGFSLKLRGRSKDDIRKAVESTAELLGLSYHQFRGLLKKHSLPERQNPTRP